MKLFVTMFAFLALSLNAVATEMSVAMITSDAEKEAGVMMLEVVSGKIDTLRIKKVAGQQILDDESHPIERLMQDGLVATERQGYEVVVLRFPGFSPVNGGVIVIDFLVNGLTRNRKQHKVKLVKEGEAFVVTTMEGAKINRLHFVSNKIFGKLVGIKSVQVSLK